MKSFQSNFAESFKGKFDKFSQAAEEKFSDVKTAIQKKLNDNNENNNNNNNKNDVAVDNSADLLQGWTLLGGDKNTRNKNIEFDDNLLEENAEDAEHAERADAVNAEHAEHAGNAGDAGTYAEDAAPASPREDSLQNVLLTTTNNNNNVDKKGNGENKVAQKESAGYFSMLTSAVIWNILSLVDAFDLCQLSTTSSHFFKLATNEFLWERLYIKVFRKNMNMKVDKALWYEQLQHGGYRALFGTKLCEEQMIKTLRSLHNTSPEANAVEWIFKPFVSVQNFFSSTEAKILMFGLDYSGKTSILYKLSRGEHVKTEHTVGFNHETIEHKGYKFELWDLEHKPKNSFEFWKTYFTKARGIIFVIDGTAPERLPQARTCLETFTADPQLSDLPILVFVNKRDVVESMSTLQVVVGLNLHYLCNRSGWHIQPCSAKDNDTSLENGLDWFCDTFKQEEVQRLKTKMVSHQ